MAETAVSANRLELLQIADAVAREKTIDKSVVLAAMEDAIQRAARDGIHAAGGLRCQCQPGVGGGPFGGHHDE